LPVRRAGKLTLPPGYRSTDDAECSANVELAPRHGADARHGLPSGFPADACLILHTIPPSPPHATTSGSFPPSPDQPSSRSLRLTKAHHLALFFFLSLAILDLPKPLRSAGFPLFLLLLVLPSPRTKASSHPLWNRSREYSARPFLTMRRTAEC
jgi:hypothetical protein